MAKRSRLVHKNPKAIDDLKKRYGKGAHIAVGLPAGTDSVGKTYPDGTPLLAVAFWNHYGTQGKRPIPQRPFLDEGGKAASKALGRSVAAIVKKVNDNEKLKEALNPIGAAAAGIVQKVITRWSRPPNAPMTIALKGDDNPLVDTGLLKKSITHQVRGVEKRK